MKVVECALFMQRMTMKISLNSSADNAPSGDYVLTNFRYLSAYNELVARISQRQQTLALFVAIFTGLVTALIATRELFKSDDYTIQLIIAGFPFASIALTLLNYKYEQLISILREYLADLERVKGADHFYPSYNCDPQYAVRANKARHFHDLTCATLIFAYNAVAIGVYHSVSTAAGQPSTLFNVVIAFVGTVCIIANVALPKVHYQIKV